MIPMIRTTPTLHNFNTHRVLGLCEGRSTSTEHTTTADVAMKAKIRRRLMEKSNISFQTIILANTQIKKQGLSDLLDTHQVQPTEVKTPKQGKDHHHSLEKTARRSLYIREDNKKRSTLISRRE